MKKALAIAASAFILGVGSGCATAPDGYADTFAGRAAAADMCRSMRSFVRAPLDTAGLRRAWFLPFGIYEDGSFDFYAPMASEPTDEASKNFYRNKVGQLTHYLRMPEFAATVAGCLTERHGYELTCQFLAREAYRAAFTETRSGRSIVIVAAKESASVLVAERGWSGDLEESLVYKPNGETPNKSMQPACEDARG